MPMPWIDILYLHYVNEDGTASIGGVQSYIREISLILTELGAQVRICQFADRPFSLKLAEHISVEGFAISETKAASRYQALYDASLRTQKEGFAFTLFATDNIIPKKLNGKAMAIQHGIAWDIPRDRGNIPLLRQFLSRCRSAYSTVRRVGQVQQVVCVDYNFLNWYRTQVDAPKTKLTVIPNYTHIAPPTEKPSERINLIFARRLVDYRGTRVFTEAVKPLLHKYEHLHITIAGSGPDESWMKQQLAPYDQVRFIQYQAQDSLLIHKDQHIAVVPTVGAEGTSLSLLEAMAAGCAVICTDVGGMTQIIANGYNGLMVPAGNANALRHGIEELIQEGQYRKALADTGYEYVKTAYSYDRWRNRWIQVLRDMLGEEV